MKLKFLTEIGSNPKTFPLTQFLIIMKRLTLNRIKKELRNAKTQLNNYWNDIEIQVDGRNLKTL